MGPLDPRKYPRKSWRLLYFGHQAGDAPLRLHAAWPPIELCFHSFTELGFGFAFMHQCRRAIAKLLDIVAVSFETGFVRDVSMTGDNSIEIQFERPIQR